MTRSITILKPGLATSVQDQGRQGYYHLGIPPSGAMDQYSFQAANLLVGNPKTAAVLECTLLAPEIRSNDHMHIAITGAQCHPKINGNDVQTHTTLTLQAGDILSFGFMSAGARAYIAFSGGIDVPEILGSRSTYNLGAIGGFHGRRLQTGDELPIGHSEANAVPKQTSLPENLHQNLAKHRVIRVIPGLYDHRLSAEGRENFYTQDWKTASEADRIGYRFKGQQTLSFVPREQPFGAGADPSNIVDAPYPIGSIQVPSGQEPIILHRDAVSGGGYAMIATVISADMDSIGQMQPNYTARFQAVSMEEALAARREYQEKLRALTQFFA